MIRMQLFAVVAVGLTAAACSYSSHTEAVVPARPVAVAPVYVAPPPTTVVYTDPTPVPVYAPAPVPPPAPAGVQAFRDEYGFRYDGQGNRLDARGNIISPQSTTP